MSNVSSTSWRIHISLQGVEGRWWDGEWQEADVFKIVSTKASEKLLQNFSTKLRETIVKGDICVGDWDPKSDTKINLTLGPSAKKPLHMPLEEMQAGDAAAFASSLLLKVAQNAQSRQCRLLPSVADLTPAKEADTDSAKSPDKGGHASTAEDKKRPRIDFGDADRIPPPRVLKGASLANPIKKARRYQPLQFADSDEEDD